MATLQVLLELLNKAFDALSSMMGRKKRTQEINQNDDDKEKIKEDVIEGNVDDLNKNVDFDPLPTDKNTVRPPSNVKMPDIDQINKELGYK